MTLALPQLAHELDTTDRTLRRALDDGLLRASRPSPRRVDISLAERAYLRTKWPLLSRLRQTLRTEPSVRLAVLFGSHARGDNRPDSDIDILVDMRPGASLRGVRRRLEGRVGVRVQVVALPEAEKAPRLLAEVLREGRVLVDRDGCWATLQRRRRRIDAAAAAERARIDAAFTDLFMPAA